MTDVERVVQSKLAAVGEADDDPHRIRPVALSVHGVVVGGVVEDDSDPGEQADPGERDRGGLIIGASGIASYADTRELAVPAFDGEAHIVPLLSSDVYEPASCSETLGSTLAMSAAYVASQTPPSSSVIRMWISKTPLSP